MKRPRLKDIADRVGCSIAVVSHVVNQSSGNISCRQDLRDLILQTAAELDYMPHYAKRALKIQRSRTIGIYIPPQKDANISLAYENPLLAGIERACREKSYHMLILCTENRAHDAECIATLNARRADGIILLHVDSEADWMFPLAENKRNIMAINYYGNAQIDTINFDNKAATALAVSELHHAGHRRIAYVGPTYPTPRKSAQLRLEGFISTCVSLGIKIDPSWVFDDAFPGTLPLERSVTPEFQIAKRIAESMPLQHRPTAFIGYSDACTHGVMRELQRMKVRIPADISAIGIDDSSMCPFIQPQLSSIRQPFITMGEKAAKHIIEQSEQTLFGQHPNPETRSRWYRLSEPTFIERESIHTRNAQQ